MRPSGRWPVEVVAAAALAQAGVLRPVGPRRLARIVAELRATGTSPSVVAAMAAIRWPDRPAVVDDSGTLTYRELDEQAAALARALVSRHDVRAGRTVAVMCRNHRGLLLGILAAGRAQADLVLVHTELPAAQLAPTLAPFAPRVLLHDADCADSVADVDASTVRLVASPGRPGEPSDVERLADDAPREGGPRRRPRASRRAPRLVILTSGTTGRPRGVPRRPDHRDLLGVVASMLHRTGLRVGGTVVVGPPAFHGLGLMAVVLALATGSTLVLRSRFDAERVARDAEERAGAVLVLVPIMVQRLLALPDVERRLARVGAVLSGGSALSTAVVEEFSARVGPVLLNGYGSSEVGVAAVATPADLEASPGTVGRPVRGVTVRVVDDQGRDLPTGADGHVVVAGRLAASDDDARPADTGHARPDHGPASRHGDAGQVDTGDVGHLDDAGRLVITGRADDMIVSGGENVFPRPVEDALLRRAEVSEAAVVGVPDPQWGQRLVAFVVPTADDVDPARLRDALRTDLTRYELPRSIQLVDQLPRGATGKILRAELVDRATTDRATTGRTTTGSPTTGRGAPRG